MKTTSHNKNSKPDKSYLSEVDDLITVHKSSITQAATQMAHMINTDVNNQNMMNNAMLIQQQHLQQTIGYQQPCVPMMSFTPTMSFGCAALVADHALAIEKQRFGDNSQD